MSQHSSSQAASVISEYTPRATSYEAAHAGWHAELADDFVSWVKPTAGEAVLDLACGTGLVTFRMAEKVGKDGIVVGIDITPAMLDVGRQRLQSQSSTDNSGETVKIEFAEADIASSRAILEIASVKQVLKQRGGFDVVSCCSALVLLDDPAAAVKVWAGLLRKGGRLIVDVPTEAWTSQHLAGEILAREIGVGFPFSRAWVKGMGSLEDVIRGAGMEVETARTTRSYLLERTFERGQAGEVFESDVLGRNGKVYREKGMVEKAREAWMGLWERALSEDGKFHDGHWLYVCIGRKL